MQFYWKWQYNFKYKNRIISFLKENKQSFKYKSNDTKISDEDIDLMSKLFEHLQHLQPSKKRGNLFNFSLFGKKS